MNRKVSKVVLYMRKIKNNIVNFFKYFSETEPMIKSEAVENTLYLLERDFKADEQNEIILNLITRLHAKREAELIKLEKEFQELKAQTESLKKKVIVTE